MCNRTLHIPQGNKSSMGVVYTRPSVFTRRHGNVRLGQHHDLDLVFLGLSDTVHHRVNTFMISFLHKADTFMMSFRHKAGTFMMS